MTTIFTKDNQTIAVEDIDYYLAGPVQEGVHWGWWVLWLILFWPALIITALIHFNTFDRLFVGIKMKNGDRRNVLLSKTQFYILENNFIKKESNK